MDPAVAWLLESDEPAVRALAKRDLLGTKHPEDANEVLDGPIVRTLLAGQQPDGGFGVHAYHKWSGAHWRLVSLVELGVPPASPAASPPPAPCSTGSPARATAAASRSSTG